MIPRAQEELIYNVFDFASREAADVMVPVADVTWLDASVAATEALDRLVTIPQRRIRSRPARSTLASVLQSPLVLATWHQRHRSRTASTSVNGPGRS